MLVIYLLMSVSWGGGSSLAKVRRAQIVTLHGEDIQKGTLQLNCIAPKRVVHNAIIKFTVDGTFHDRKRSGRLRKTTPIEDRSVRQIVMRSPKSSTRKSVLFYT